MYEYTPEGLLKSAITEGMRYSYTYDAMGRLTEKKTSYDDGYGTRVCYYLPDFYDIKPDLGDYLQADLDIKKIISKEELQKMYSEATYMELKINEEYMRLHDSREINRENDKDELIK